MTNAEYVQMTGLACPVCHEGPKTLLRGPLERLAELVIQKHACTACHSTWTAVFMLSHYADLALLEVHP